MATLSETCALNSREYISEPGMSILNLSKKFKLFWSHSSVFALENYPKNVQLSEFFTSYLSKESSLNTFSETCALTSRIYVSEIGISIPNLS